MTGRQGDGGTDGVFQGGVRRRRGPGLVGMLAIVVLLLAAVAVAGWLYVRSRDTAAPITAEAPAREVAPAPAPDPGLPELDASDAFVRDAVAALSSRPAWAAWLANERLVRRFVRGVVAVSGGQSPTTEVEFLKPEGSFEARRDGETLVPDAASYGRYDLASTVFTSLDTRGTARLYGRLRPLFQTAYEDLGFRRGSFDGALAAAIDHLLDAPVPDGPVTLVRADSLYIFADPRLERLSPAQKHLLRLGPENARRVQAKLEELRAALPLDTKGAGGT
ncbi:MAG: DUF3014 domain-containing protein [Gemmatimonadota bacterium]|nr:DUF3014 domain-containing protein [Gemmatimonadota bacterium]